MDKSREERIRERAHEIWESKGRPHGDHEADWHKAVRDIEEHDLEQASTLQLGGKASVTESTDGVPAERMSEGAPVVSERTAIAGATTNKSPPPKAR